MELSDYIRILRKSWLVILATTLIGLAAAAGYSLTRTPMYESQAVVFVQSQAGGTASELQQGSSFAESRITTYVTLVREPVVMNPVITELELNTSANELAKQVEVSSSPLNSTLIEITVQDPDPVQAADIANALARASPRQLSALTPPPVRMPAPSSSHVCAMHSPRTPRSVRTCS